MKILVTGAAGFIGFHLSKMLAEKGNNVVGIDNINDYYDVNLKYSRLSILENVEGFEFKKIDLKDKEDIDNLFKIENFDYRWLNIVTESKLYSRWEAIREQK